MTRAGQFRVAPDHPCLPGHFPGRAVAPGAMLLDHVTDLIIRRHPGARIAGFESVRFLEPVLPGATVDVDCAEPLGGSLAFTCSAAGRLVVRGTVRLAP